MKFGKISMQVFLDDAKELGITSLEFYGVVDDTRVCYFSRQLPFQVYDINIKVLNMTKVKKK